MNANQDKISHFIETNTPHSWARLDGVDILRGVAILCVLMNHVNMRLYLAKIPYTQGLPSQLVSSLVWNGQYGVQIFFVVSGFLITSTSLRRWGALSKVSVKDFYVLRFARIGPLLLALLAVLSMLHAMGIEDFIVSEKTGGLSRAVVAALTFQINVLEASRGYLPGNWDILWSLSVEEIFYLFFPPVCRFLSHSNALIVLLLILVVLGPFGRTVFAHNNEVWQEYSYLGGMDAIALGCLTAIISSRATISRDVVWALGVLGMALVLFILGFSEQATKWGLSHYGVDMTILAIGSCMMTTSAAQTRWKAPRAFYPIIILGRRSYEVYLTHMFVVFALFDSFRSAGQSMGNIPYLFVATVVVAGVVGEMVGRFFSEPANRAIRRLFGDGPDRLGSVVRSDAAT
jgi:peptidoglycan/LPS O-acetylase OafA/YrhL